MDARQIHFLTAITPKSRVEPCIPHALPPLILRLHRQGYFSAQ
ncbi:hypothetical protein C4K40_5803 [Pseudomonas sp. CMR5c]|nr:hypothetical protein C4K40_5803 [Pseudomonas sp. CMR5c]